MKITSISYSQSKESVINGLKRWDKVGVEVEINEKDFFDGEVPQIKVAEDAFQFAKKVVEDSLNSLQEKNESPNEKQQPPSEINLAHERELIEIENKIVACQTKNELITLYKTLPSTIPLELYNTYLDKLKQLQ